MKQLSKSRTYLYLNSVLVTYEISEGLMREAQALRIFIVKEKRRWGVWETSKCNLVG